MRARLSGGHPEAPILLSVGRLGNEKNLKFLKVSLACLLAVLPGCLCLREAGSAAPMLRCRAMEQSLTVLQAGP